MLIFPLLLLIDFYNKFEGGADVPRDYLVWKRPWLMDYWFWIVEADYGLLLILYGWSIWVSSKQAMTYAWLADEAL